jgi:streptogramin lyase
MAREMPLTRSLFAFLAVVSALVVTPHASPARAASVLQVLATVGGQPDDITPDTHGRLVWGDLASGTIDRFDGKRVIILARNLSVPEGIVVLPNGNLIVAEQGRDRIVRIGSRGNVTVVFALQPVPGQEGVDGIGRDPRSGNLLIPDSPNGTFLTMSAGGRHVRLVARGLGRPVDAAIDASGNILIPDEHLGTLVVVNPRGRVSHRGTFSTPDDVVVDRSGTVWLTSLGDGGLWRMKPGSPPVRVLAGLANPQGLTLDRCGDPIIVEQNSGTLVRLLLTSASRRCPL